MDSMSQELYARPDIYDIVYKKDREDGLKKHYKRLLGDKGITTIHDCSIGTGQLTFVLSDMGYKISGSDLSEEMLENARKNAEDRNIDMVLFQSDFRTVSENHNTKYDCVMSTGNSLAHVSNEDVKEALKSMSELVSENGFIYIDTRNWDKILKKKQRFFCYNPFFKEDERINLVQVWDHISEREVHFNLLYTFEKNNKIHRQEEVHTIYHPLKKQFLIESLEELGFTEFELHNFMNPAVTDFEEMDWYGICARKF